MAQFGIQLIGVASVIAWSAIATIAITFVTLGLLAVLSASGSYMEPYRASALGQLVLGGLLTVFGALLVAIRKMSTPKPLPRFFTSKEVAG